MVTYKVNIEIKEELNKEWFHWMSTQHIPDVINTGLFLDFSFSRLVPNGSIPTPGYIKYQILYFCQGMKEYETYRKEFADKLQLEHITKYKGSFNAEREIYEDVTPEMIEERRPS